MNPYQTAIYKAKFMEYKSEREPARCERGLLQCILHRREGAPSKAQTERLAQIIRQVHICAERDSFVMYLTSWHTQAF
jgi:hypothetical protein